MIRDVQHQADFSHLPEIIRRIVAAIDPDRIILFGSRARGAAHAESDYDLLVIKATSERTLKLEQAAYRALVGILGPVDILVETPERLERLKDSPGLVFHDALAQGRLIYERSCE
ncbi:MAG: nucleotidyltransferase domain-containing protein [Phycisphaerae bacterium]